MKRKDKVLTYAIGISVAVHIIAIGVVGRSSASRLSTSTFTEPARLIDVNLIDNNPPQPVKHVSLQTTQPKTETSEPIPEQRDFSQPQTEFKRFASVSSMPGRQIRTSATANRLPGNPGGRLNTGSVSAHGDLGGNWQGGRTPVGWVSGSDDTRGKGSGRGDGEGRPEPVSNASEGPGNRPEPAVIAAPSRVSVRICDISEMLPNDNCNNTHVESFIDGSEPTSRCHKCKAPEYKSRLADQEKPVLSRDTRVNVPSSVDEGMSFNVGVEYTVNTEGDVTGINITKSSGNRAVDRAVISAVGDLRYKPAIQDGVPRSVRMTRTYKINT